MLDWFNNKTIAIVGNSESLFSKNQGLEIDSHDVVCRINRGISIIDKSHQGLRTDIWAYGIFKHIEDIYEMFKGPKTIHLSPKKRRTRVEGFKLKQWEHHSYTDFYLPISQIEELYFKFNYDRISSGLLLLNYIDSCNPKFINLYGFDWKITSTWYFHEFKTVHKWEEEKKFVQKNFLNKNYIKLK
jgi:hypothetical protein